MAPTPRCPVAPSVDYCREYREHEEERENDFDGNAIANRDACAQAVHAKAAKTPDKLGRGPARRREGRTGKLSDDVRQAADQPDIAGYDGGDGYGGVQVGASDAAYDHNSQKDSEPVTQGDYYQPCPVDRVYQRLCCADGAYA